MPIDLTIIIDMKTRGIAEIAQGVPAVIREAENGPPILVTRNNLPVVVMLPANEETIELAKRITGEAIP